MSATAGSCTISSILDFTKSAANLLASSFTTMSRKVPDANMNPPWSQAPSNAARRSSGPTSSAEMTLAG